jgi:hypothetical protein
MRDHYGHKIALQKIAPAVFVTVAARLVCRRCRRANDLFLTKDDSAGQDRNREKIQPRRGQSEHGHPTVPLHVSNCRRRLSLRDPSPFASDGPSVAVMRDLSTLLHTMTIT